MTLSVNTCSTSIPSLAPPDIPSFNGGQLGRPKATKRLSDDPEYKQLQKEVKKYRQQMKRAKTDEGRRLAEKRLQEALDAIEAMKGR